MGMNAPKDFTCGLLFADTWPLCEVCRHSKWWKFIRDLIGCSENDIGSLAGGRFNQEPVFDDVF
jgi:hypothetical protein